MNTQIQYIKENKKEETRHKAKTKRKMETTQNRGAQITTKLEKIKEAQPNQHGAQDIALCMEFFLSYFK